MSLESNIIFQFGVMISNALCESMKTTRRCTEGSGYSNGTRVVFYSMIVDIDTLPENESNAIAFHLWSDKIMVTPVRM